MAVAWSYTPPTVNAVARVQSAGEAAVRAGAEVLLEASQRLVPVDTGALRASGEVSQDGLEAAVSYGREDGAGRDGRNTSDYCVKQHEDLSLNHPNGGQGKWLESSMHAEAGTVAELLAETVRKALLF